MAAIAFERKQMILTGLLCLITNKLNISSPRGLPEGENELQLLNPSNKSIKLGYKMSDSMHC